MEHAQRDGGKVVSLGAFQNVLILILMEHAQRVSKHYETNINNECLNPYFNGTCSKRAFFVRPYVLICYVVKFTLINVFVLIKCTCFMQKIVQR